MYASEIYARAYGDHPDQYKAAIEKKNFDGTWSRNSVIVTLSIALGLYNSLEMVLLILSTFKKWKGLYFWSMNLCNLGIVLYSLGMMLMYFNIGPLLLCKIVLDIGWALMVVCQSLVLYSRLGLIVDNLTIISAVKWYIIVDSAILVIITLVLDFGVTYGPPGFTRAYFYIEHIQVTGFTLQEVIISSVYVWKTIRFLQICSKQHTRRTIWQLLIINVIIIVMDILIIFLQFKHLQLYQESIKGFVYSVKLKLELNILSKLVDLVESGSNGNRSATLATIDSETIIGQAQAEVQRENVTQDPLTTWFGSDEKYRSIVKETDEGEGSQSSRDGDVKASGSTSASTSQPSHHDDHAEVMRMRSHTTTSGYSSRANGRESDMLYADMLRSISNAR